MSTKYLCVNFLSRSFLAVTIMLFLAQDILSLKVYNKIVKKQLTSNLYIQMLCTCLTYQNHRYETGGNSVHWMFTTFCVFFFFSSFLFCLPDMCACAIFQEIQNKCKPSIQCLEVTESVQRKSLFLTTTSRSSCQFFETVISHNETVLTISIKPPQVL